MGGGLEWIGYILSKVGGTKGSIARTGDIKGWGGMGYITPTRGLRIPHPSSTTSGGGRRGAVRGYPLQLWYKKWCAASTYFLYPLLPEGVQFSENPRALSKIPNFKINGLLFSPLSENSPSSEVPPLNFYSVKVHNFRLL